MTYGGERENKEDRYGNQPAGRETGMENKASAREINLLDANNGCVRLLGPQRPRHTRKHATAPTAYCPHLCAFV